MNSSCPICFDLFVGCDICATPCGHVFHSKCIFRWIDSSKACPECRKNLTRNNVIKLYFNTAHNETLQPNASLQNDLDSKEAELRAKDREISLAKNKIKDLQEHSAKIEEMYQKYLDTESKLTSAKLQLQRIHKLEAKVQLLTKENVRLERHVTQFSHIRTVLEGNQHEAEEVLQEQGALLSQEVGGHVARNMAALCSTLKRENLSLKRQKEESNLQSWKLSHAQGTIKFLREDLTTVSGMHREFFLKYVSTQTKLRSSELQFKEMEAKVQLLTKENVHLESEITQFSRIRTVLEGNQHEAEEVLREQGALLSQEVGGHVAKNMAALCSTLKRENLSLKGQKEESKKSEDELLHQLSIKNAKIKKPSKTSIPSPRPVNFPPNGKNGLPRNSDLLVDRQLVEEYNRSGQGVSTVCRFVDLTPISIQSANKRKRFSK